MALLCYLCKFCTTGSPFPDSDVKFRASSLRVSNVILFPTRLHSSRMRTARSLTVSPSMLCSWGVGGLVRGLAWSCGGGGGAWSWGWYPSMHWGRPPALWTEWQTGVKILPCPKLRLRAVTKKSGSEISKELNEGYSRNYLTRLAFLNKSWGTDCDRHGQVRFNCRIQNLTDLPLFGRIVYVSKHSDQFLKLLKKLTNRFIFTGRNEVVAKVIFLHLSVIHSFHRGGVCLSACWDVTPPPGSRHTPPGADTTPPGPDPPEQTPPPPGADSSIRSTSGRYASYWNAFLFS